MGRAGGGGNNKSQKERDMLAQKNAAPSVVVDSSQVQVLQAKIKDVQAENDLLKQKHQQAVEEFRIKWKEAKEASESEQHLIISAFYEMGMENVRLRRQISQSAKVPSGSTNPLLRSWMNQRRQDLLPNFSDAATGPASSQRTKK